MLVLAINSSAIANPSKPTEIPVILVSEVMIYDSLNWTIKAVVNPFGYNHNSGYNVNSLDSFYIKTSAGLSFFKKGIKVNYNDSNIILITQENLQTPLKINRKGDFIDIIDTGVYQKGFYDSISVSDFQTIRFGNISGSVISSPFTGQSLVIQQYQIYNVPLVGGPCMDGNYPAINYFYLVCKENKPFSESVPFQCNTYTTFTGHIFDKYNQPVGNDTILFLNYYYLFCGGYSPFNFAIEANDLGYFSDSTFSVSSCGLACSYYNHICASRYNMTILKKGCHLDTTINLEPDSVYNLNFYYKDCGTYDNLSQSLKTQISITNYPNPFTGETNFDIIIPESASQQKVIIKVFNRYGDLLSIIPVHEQSFKWNGTDFNGNKLSSGEYYSNLEINNNKVASNKMIIYK